MAKDRQPMMASPETVISIIGPGMKVVGDLVTDGTLRIEGTVEGTIRAGKAVVIGKDGVVFTPAPNGTFLNGITRQRVIKLLRDAGVDVIETVLSYRDVQNADEIFSSGNYSKVMPVNRIDERSLQPGPLYRKARELYWDFAHA